LRVEQPGSSSNDSTGSDPKLSWDAFVLSHLHPTKFIIVEAMRWIGRPISATELERIVGGELELTHFPYHLKRLVAMEVLEVVVKLKTRKSQSSKKETFFYFARQDQWAEPIARLNDPGDFLTQVALRVVGHDV
jgi:hypothetical protein